MLKAIFAKHVKEGDAILVPGGKRISVEWTDQRGTDIRVGFGDKQHLDLGEYDIVGLGHRPYPKDKRDSDLLDELVGLAERFALVRSFSDYEADEAATKLLETLEVYKLGKK